MLLRWLISAIGFAALKGEVSGMVQRAARRAVLLLVVLVLWFAAFGFAIAALAVWLASELGVLPALGIMAGIFVAIAIAIHLILAADARKKPPRPAATAVPFPGLSTGPDGKTNLDMTNLGSLTIVAVAGFLLGRQIFRK
jgi:hypothetical protein